MRFQVLGNALSGKAIVLYVHSWLWSRDSHAESQHPLVVVHRVRSNQLFHAVAPQSMDLASVSKLSVSYVAHSAARINLSRAIRETRLRTGRATIVFR